MVGRVHSGFRRQLQHPAATRHLNAAAKFTEKRGYTQPLNHEEATKNHEDARNMRTRKQTFVIFVTFVVRQACYTKSKTFMDCGA